MNQVETFRNIRYATAERFQQPELVPWDGVRRLERGPICPQMPSRLELVQGPLMALKQDEHCQVLSVFTPAVTGHRPVMVFIHGGGFVTGGGELPWHDGDKLAAEQDVVVVSITYRLGVFGYFQFPSSEGPSLAMADQVVALQWIKANIAAFGGDPNNVTVFGQSAGGFSIAAMMAWGHGGALFQRAIMQSGSKGAARTREEGAKTSQLYIAELQREPRFASVEDLLAAQHRLATKLNQIILFAPISPANSIGSGVDVIAGWTRDDALPFVLLKENLRPVKGIESRYQVETQTMNELFEGGSRTMVRDMKALGHRASLYRFDWESPNTGLGACHCIELPFLLGSKDAWKAAPALAGADWTEIESIGKTMRQLWADFARGKQEDASWKACSPRLLP